MLTRLNLFAIVRGCYHATLNAIRADRPVCLLDHRVPCDRTGMGGL